MFKSKFLIIARNNAENCPKGEDLVSVFLEFLATYKYFVCIDNIYVYYVYFKIHNVL